MKILYVTTVGSTMTFFIQQFKHLMQQGHVIELACSDTLDYENDIAELGLKRYIVPFSRNPLSTNNMRAYLELRDIVATNKYDIVHCHTPNASAITRLACKDMRNKGTRVIYTAHGFHFFKGAPKRNWVLYYPVEWICAHFTDVLITINVEDYEFAKKHFKAKSVRYVPGVGVDIENFERVNITKSEKREELNIPESATVLLSIGELNDNKNHETVIRAIPDLNVYYLIAGQGSNSEKLKMIAKNFGISDKLRLLGFRTDIAELLMASDIFVFPSYREGLSVSLMEAMARGLPVAVSRIRGNVDLIDERGGELFDPHSVGECKRAIRKVLEDDRELMGDYNRRKIQKFSTNVVLEIMDKIYGECY